MVAAGVHLVRLTEPLSHRSAPNQTNFLYRLLVCHVDQSPSVAVAALPPVAVAAAAAIQALDRVVRCVCLLFVL